jgi:hypothetical protein
MKRVQEKQSMSATSTAAWQWSPEVLAYARAQGIESYLEPLRQATLRVYPTARELRVFKEDDRELRDVRWIVFEVFVPDEDLTSFVELANRWSDEGRAVCPSVLFHHFVLSVRTARP